MLTAPEERRLRACAYVPEHVPGYVQAISRAEPFLFGQYLLYRSGPVVIFIGYPLAPAEPADLSTALQRAIETFRPSEVALVAPALPDFLRSADASPDSARDQYYRLDLSRPAVPAKVRNMIRRAARDLDVEVGRTITRGRWTRRRRPAWPSTAPRGIPPHPSSTCWIVTRSGASAGPCRPSRRASARRHASWVA